MQEIILENKKYKLLKNYKDGFDLEIIKEKFTDYFLNYDYVAGDWSYGKLRLKGFNKKNNKNFNKINDFSNFEKYLIEHCAHDCRYFILEKSD